MSLSILSVLSPIRGKVLALFLLCPSWLVSEALEEKFVQGFLLESYQKSIYLGLKQLEHFSCKCWSVRLCRHWSCCIPDLLMTLELLCSYSSHEVERLQMSSREVTLPCRKNPSNPSYPHLYGPSHLKANEHLHSS